MRVSWEKFRNVFFLSSSLVGIGFSCYTSVRSGISWDSSFDIRAWEQVRTISPAATLAQAYEATPTNWQFYGLSYLQISQWVHQTFTSSNLYFNPWEPATYLWMNFTSLAIFLFTSLIVSATFNVVYNSTKYFYFCFCILTCTPVFIGLTIVDYKDTYVASGILLICSASSLLITSNYDISFKKTQVINNGGNVLKKLKFMRNKFFIAILIVVGTHLALGTRIGTIIILFPVLIFSFIFTIFSFRMYTLEKITYFSKSFFLFIFTPFILSVLTLQFTNPFARADLFQWILDSIKISLDYPLDGFVRSGGMNLDSQHLPSWYLISWIVISIPVLLLISILLGLLGFHKKLTDDLLGKNIKLLGMLPFTIIGLGFFIVYTFSTPPDMDGFRHIYFSVISIVLIAIFGIDYFENFQRNRAWIFLGRFFTLAVPISLIFSALLWLPYTYAYKNILVGEGSPVPKWELDFWGTSAREAVGRLQDQYHVTRTVVLPYGESAYSWGASPFDIPGDRLSIQKISGGEDDVTGNIGVYSFNRFTWATNQSPLLTSCANFVQSSCKNFMPLKCRQVFQITRASQILGTAAVCRFENRNTPNQSSN
jgi:hypothetical protein